MQEFIQSQFEFSNRPQDFDRQSPIEAELLLVRKFRKLYLHSFLTLKKSIISRTYSYFSTNILSKPDLA